MMPQDGWGTLYLQGRKIIHSVIATVLLGFGMDIKLEVRTLKMIGKRKQNKKFRK
jgi:hypoxanthine-guanine phosphoribosyltransferase